MNKTVALFSGQGSQYVGMGKELNDNYREASEIFSIANEVLGFDLRELCFNGTEEELSKTIVAQPAILAVSLCSLMASKANGLKYSAVVGHSLGEYAAMVASEMISVRQAFEIIKARANAMQNASDNSNGAMAAIIGLPATEIEEVCNEIDGYVVPVNYNSTVQTVIAGEIEPLEKASQILADKKARVMRLNVSSAFHSKLMQGAADEFHEAIKNHEFTHPTIPFYSNLTGDQLKDTSDMPAYLGKHIVSPVRFTNELLALSEKGYTNFVELGPNKILTGLVKKTLKSVTALNVENIKTLEKAKAELSW